ncbi:MAG: hypothetical protein ACRES9_02760 [Gammaproteobacteria bacterium]
MSRKIGIIAILGGALLIAGCGNGNSSLGGGGGPTPPPASSAVALGSGNGSSFQQGVLGIASPDLSAGGSTTVSAVLQYGDGTLYTGSAKITFTSPCYQNGSADFSVNGNPTNVVTNATGQVNITYTATGCNGTDTITATTTVNGKALSATGTVTVTPSVVLGSGSGSSFQQGVLGIAVSNLSAGGSTTVSAALQYTDGTPYTASATITFTSPCYQNGLAGFAVNGQATNTVTTTTGQANITYNAKGCSGKDTITATTTINNNNLTATGTVTVAPAAVGAIQFVSATPEIISLRGTGGPETSTVIFKVTDSSGGPVPQAHVQFSLNTTVGGITLSPASATTGNNGEAQTVVQAGTQHTTVRVTATTKGADGETISTQSPGIVISTGIPTEKHFSLSVGSHNVEGYGVDGTTDQVTVILSDRFGNPVPASTAVAFTANGGQIQPSCVTQGETGSCSVTWTSANPRPPAPQSGPNPLSIIGHAEILATATGEESFTDVNGDGIFDQGDQFSLYADGGADNFFLSPPPQDDIGEVYLDQAQIGKYVDGDYFFDFNHNGKRDVPDGKFYGYGYNQPSCKPANNPPVPCGGSTFGVGLQTCIVMTTSGVTISGPSKLSPGQTATYTVSDYNGNVPPSGMTFSISANGPSASILQTTVPSIGGCPKPPASYPITVNVSPTSQSGTFVIVATSPVTNTVSYSKTIAVSN